MEKQNPPQGLEDNKINEAGRWAEKPFVAILLCLASGIGISRFITEYSFATLVLATLAFLVAAFQTLISNRLELSLACALSALILCGVVLGLARRDAYPETDARALLAKNLLPLDDLVAFDGCIDEEIVRQSGEQIATLQLRGFRIREQWVPGRGRVLLRIPELAVEDSAAKPAVLQYGDRVRGWAEWNVPRNFKNPGGIDRVGFLARRDIFLSGRIKSQRVLEILPGDCGSAWKRAAITVRARLRDSINTLAAQGSEREPAILLSLLIGDYSNLDRATREVFQNAGTYHVLVVSGLHVGWIAWLLVHFLHLLRVPENAGRLLVAGGLVAYAAVVGFQASITRSLWVLLIYLAGQSLFRRANPTNLLMAAACALLVTRPDWLADIAFHLSFLSVLAIFLMGLPVIEKVLLPALEPLRHAGEQEWLSLKRGSSQRLGRRWRTRAETFAEACADRSQAWIELLLLEIVRRGASCVFYLGATVLISLAVQVWLGPLLALHFNRLSWISPAANLVVVPLSSLTLALAALAATLGWIFDPTLFLGIASWSGSVLFEITAWMAALPGAWQRCPTPSGYLVCSGLLLIFVWSMLEWRALWLPCSAIAALLVTLGYASLPLGMLSGRNAWPSLRQEPAPAALPGTLRLTFLDVGQGDSVVIQFPNSAVWVLDAGGIRTLPEQEEGGNSFDIGESVVSRYLWSQGIRRLERMVLSHPHQDHGGGMPALMKNFSVGRLDYGEPGTDALLSKLLIAADERAVPSWRMAAGETLCRGEVGVEFLNPPDDGRARSINNNSLVLRLVYRKFSALLAGDLEQEGENTILARTPELASTLLKVAHHGSRSATSLPLLDRTKPRWAVLSAGRNNPFRHPAREVLFRLIQKGVLPLLTLDQGAITVETDGSHYVLSSYVSGVIGRGVLPD